MQKYLQKVKKSVDIWTGPVDEIPDGYAPCDGNLHNGVRTINLNNNKFVRVVSSIPGGENESNWINKVLNNYTTPMNGNGNTSTTDDGTAHVHRHNATSNDNTESYTHDHDDTILFATQTKVNITDAWSGTAEGKDDSPYSRCYIGNNTFNKNVTINASLKNDDNKGEHTHNGINTNNSNWLSDDFDQTNAVDNNTWYGEKRNGFNATSNAGRKRKGICGTDIQSNNSHVHNFSHSDNVTEPSHRTVFFIMWVGV